MEKLDSHPTIIISMGDIAVYLLFAGTQIIWEVFYPTSVSELWPAALG